MTSSGHAANRLGAVLGAASVLAAFLLALPGVTVSRAGDAARSDQPESASLEAGVESCRAEAARVSTLPPAASLEPAPAAAPAPSSERRRERPDRIILEASGEDYVLPPAPLDLDVLPPGVVRD